MSANKKQKIVTEGEGNAVPLSEEDQQFKEEIDLLVTRITEPNGEAGLRKTALSKLHEEIRTATSSMTSVPRPLKFLRPHYDTLAAYFTTLTSAAAAAATTTTTTNDSNEDSEVRRSLADLLAVLAMTREAEATERASLRYKLQGTLEHIDEWGHDFVRNLSGELGKEYLQRLEAAGGDVSAVDARDLEPLVGLVLPFLMAHGSEPEACDLMIELGRPAALVDHVDYAADGSGNFDRVSTYLTACARYFPEPDNSALRRTALAIHRRAQQWSSALLLALSLGDAAAAQDIIAECGSAPMRRQLAFLLARHGAPGAGDLARAAGEAAGADDEECDTLSAIASNQKLSELFVRAVESLNLGEARDPAAIVKVPLALTPTWLDTSEKSNMNKMESSRKNLALTLVNALVNCGYGTEALFAKDPDWLFHHTGRGFTSATASLGLTMLWDVDNLSALDKYTHSSDPYIFAGSLLAIGTLNATVRSDADPALGLILDALENSPFQGTGSHPIIPACGCLGIGLAYAGTARDDVAEVLAAYFEDPQQPVEVRVVAALAVGLVFAGSANGDVLSRLCDTLSADSEGPRAFEQSSLARLAYLALGLVVLGRGDDSAIAQEVAMTLGPKVADYARMCVVSCAYAASGNVLMIQDFLRSITDASNAAKARKEAAALAALEEKVQAAKKQQQQQNVGGNLFTAAAAASGGGNNNGPEGEGEGSKKKKKEDEEKRKEKEEKENSPEGFAPQSVAVLGIGLAAMGEKIGDEMVLRTLDHILQFGDIHARRAVPLTLGLLSVSNPRIPVVDALVRLAHDTDPTTAGNAVLGLGLVAAGSNNTRVTVILHTLAVYHRHNQALLFAVRIAEGLVALGKGALTLAPLHSDRQLLSVPATAGLLVLLHAGLDVQKTLLGEFHYLLFAIAAAVYPRVLLTIDDSDAMDSVTTVVRVGQAVDTAGQAGRPKAITGFQTHNTPVLIGFGERAEMATDDYVPYSKCLEGVVLLKKVSDSSSSSSNDTK